MLMSGVSTNLAVELARRDQRVVLVDLDLQFGDIGLALGLVPERTVYELAKAGRPYDHDKIDRHLMRHPSGVKVLVGPTRPDHASAVTVDFLREGWPRELARSFGSAVTTLICAVLAYASFDMVLLDKGRVDTLAGGVPERPAQGL